jgi:hypothetical protein
MKLGLLAVLALSSLSVFANEFSAYRPLSVDYSQFEKKVISENTDEKMLLSRTPIGIARLYTGDEKLPKSIGWKSVKDMQERFEHFRDERFMKDPANPNFLRRISWLYPKDGCWTRAALFNRHAFRNYIPIPNKVFAFGNLRVKTNNSRRGVVGWWYHVAPMVQIGDQKYVLDAAIEHRKPLPLKEWLAKMGRPERIKVAICGSGTYSPGDTCDKESDGVESRAERAQREFLALEKRELQALGRNHESELGDNPPWTLEN